MEEAREALWYKGAYEIEVERNTALEKKLVEAVANTSIVLAENEELTKKNANMKRTATAFGLISLVELGLILIGLALHFVPSP